ncbi:MAG: sigma-70 family RNA polymerase sigma factor [Solirubrobacteraceae bacterium]
MTSRHRSLATADRESLIESHLPLAKSVARRYVGRGVELDDLVQVAAVGLVKAANRFDIRRGVSFPTFAEPTIEGEIRHHLRDRSGTVRIPRELQRLGKRLRSRQSELAASLGRAPTLSELADAVDADTKEVERALAAEQAREPVSLPRPEDGGEAGPADEPFGDTDDRLLLTERMHILDERERQIVYLRFHGDMTERQIAREVGISQAHVSRLLAGALTKLRAELAEDKTPATAGDTTLPSVVSRETEAPGTPETGPAKPPGTGKPGAKPLAGYSGRFLVRMSGELHQQLAQAAEREQVSLNRFVTDALAESVTGERPHEPAGAPGPSPDPPHIDHTPEGRPHDPRRTLRVVLAANLVVVVLAGTIAVVLLVLALRQGL